MTAYWASRVHCEPLADTLAVEAVSAVANPSRALNGFLTDGTRRVGCIDVRFRCGGNLSPSGNYGNGIEKRPQKVSTGVEECVQRNVHHQSFRRRGRRPCCKTSKNRERKTRVAKMRRHNVIAGSSVQKANHAEKGTICHCQIANCVQDRVLVVHACIGDWIRKSLVYL